MEHLCSSKKDGCLLIDPNKNKGHEILNSNHQDQEEPPLFEGFPSPFFDEISSTITTTTTPILINSHTNHHHHHHHHHQPCSESNRLIKKRTSTSTSSVSKKDRHSKIHTAQGLRDRRMRLSLDIARKFFDLQDLLGFDKASNTINWLFSKSNKAIKEVAAQNFNQTLTQQEMDSLISQCETNKLDNTKEDQIQKKESKKRVHNYSYLAKETRDQARARARDRTRERLIEKSKQCLFQEGNPKKDEIYKLGIGYETSPNNHNVLEKLGHINSSQHIQQEASSTPILAEEHSTSHHLLREHLQLANINVDSFENYLINHNNSSTGCQNSSDGLFGEYWDADDDNFCNYGMVPTTSGDIYEQNPSSFFMSITTNILHFQSQNQAK